MSNVTNVLILATWERDAMDALTNSARRWDDTAPWRGYFGSISRQPAAEYWGDDGKWPECDVWAGAFNHLNRPALLGASGASVGKASFRAGPHQRSRR